MDKSQTIEVILIEDDMSDAELTIRVLKKNKMANNLIHLKDGKEAIDFMFGEGEYAGRNMDNKPRLILLDLKMPRMNGIEVLQKLKGDLRTRHIPVVVLTSSKESPDLLECYKLGVNSYIVKPIGFESFTSAVTQIGLYWLLLNHPDQI